MPALPAEGRTQVKTALVSRRVLSTWNLELILRVRALDLSAHAAREHERDHLVVAHERPERVLERGGAVVLDEEVADPRGRVAGHERDGQPAPAPRRRERDKQGRARQRARRVQGARRGSAVLAHVEGPELLERLHLALSHTSLLK